MLMHKGAHQFHAFLFMILLPCKQMPRIMKPCSNVNSKHFFFTQLVMRSNFFCSVYNIPGVFEGMKDQLWLWVRLKQFAYIFFNLFVNIIGHKLFLESKIEFCS